MNTKLVEKGQRVRTYPSNSKGLLARACYMKNRKEGRTGVILRTFDPVAVPLGHAAAWVRHDDDQSMAPYWYHELTAIL